VAGGKRLSDLTAEDVENIILNYYDDIYKYCYWKVKNCSDAEDLTQETFLRFVQVFFQLFRARKTQGFVIYHSKEFMYQLV